MAIAKIKTAEERERLDRIFAEVEATERGGTPARSHRVVRDERGADAVHDGGKACEFPSSK